MNLLCNLICMNVKFPFKAHEFTRQLDRKTKDLFSTQF